MFLRPILLGSQSPRRQQLLKDAHIQYTLLVKPINEIFSDDLPINEVPAYLAVQKAKELYESITSNEIIITADTIVCLNNTIYGKPTDKNDAIRILQLLSGNKHTVITGVCLMDKNKTFTFSVHTDVYFYPLNKQQIEWYVDAYKPYDKAGAYAIQEWIGLAGIERIDGCFYNVMGLPISRLLQELQKF